MKHIAKNVINSRKLTKAMNKAKKCEKKFFYAPIPLRHFRVLFTRIQKAKQNIRSDARQEVLPLLPGRLD